MNPTYYYIKITHFSDSTIRYKIIFKHVIVCRVPQHVSPVTFDIMRPFDQHHSPNLLERDEQRRCHRLVRKCSKQENEEGKMYANIYILLMVCLMWLHFRCSVSHIPDCSIPCELHVFICNICA